MIEIQPDLFRRVLGHLPTGVTIVTAYGGEEPVGLAANSVTSVSLVPPMILVCPAKSSTTWPAIRDSGRFCVNVMADGHGPTCRRFATKGIDRFAGLAWHRRPCGPGLDGAVAWIECALSDEHDAGDHTVAVARVLALEAASDAVPLVFFRGRYGTFVER
jgi:3-hydroxy-9,10-secoandrosta-1,3,5(10)-triene-9,17-dione monooxygenase reductase component